MITDNRIACTLTEIYESWTLSDLYEAHDVLNALDEFERNNRPRKE